MRNKTRNFALCAAAVFMLAGLDRPVHAQHPDRIPSITLRFRPTAEQAASLDQLLQDQQNPASPLYHAWLTSEQYAERFGLNANDLARVRQWIESQGFQVTATANSRTWISFSHNDQSKLDAQGRKAGVSGLELPADLQSMVYSIRGLDDLGAQRLRPQHHSVTSNGENAIIPGDLAIIYNLAPLHEKGVTGAGQKIVIVGESEFDMADIQKFRAMLGLRKNDPQVVLVPGSAEPGIRESGIETLLGLEYAGASAPDATIIYVNSDSVWRSVEYAIDRNLAPVISMSFGFCERGVAVARGLAEELRNMAQQANAQGITWIASSGDSGPAACERQMDDEEGYRGLSVNVPASLPEVTAIGGTTLNEGTASYWNPNANPAATTAKSYIPETAWNETEISGRLAASGGGPSVLYPKPAWQSGPGVPTDDVRHVPDIAFTASWLHNPYLVVADGETLAAGGTSAAAPYFAGVVALLNQHLLSTGAQAKPGLGNINPKLYRLAQTIPDVFHDITSGDNIIPCRLGTRDCENTRSYGFKAGAGYDQVTGLGSVDFRKLFDNWTSNAQPGQTSTALSLTVTPSVLAFDSSTTLTATVQPASGSTSPAGTVTFAGRGGSLGSALLSGSGGVSTAILTVNGSQLGGGVNTITASYGGSSGFGSSMGSATITVQATASVVVPSVEPSIVYQQAPDEDGYSWRYTVRIAEIGGIPTTITSFSIDGFDMSALLATAFGGTNLAGHGSRSAPLKSRELAVPSDHVFAFSGVDFNGQRWTKQIVVPFRGEPAMSLTSVPAVVVKGTTNCPAERPYYHRLKLIELEASEITLTKFVAGGSDYSNKIANWFGSQKLLPMGTLRANMCWQFDSVPTTVHYEVGGINSSGKPVRATLQVEFTNSDAPSSPAAANRSPGVMIVAPQRSNPIAR